MRSRRPNPDQFDLFAAKPTPPAIAAADQFDSRPVWYDRALAVWTLEDPALRNAPDCTRRAAKGGAAKGEMR